jgi:hypothetical protein
MDLNDRVDDFEVIDRRDVAHGLAVYHHAILKCFLAGLQQRSASSEASFDRGGALDLTLVALQFMSYQGAVSQYVDFLRHRDLPFKQKSLRLI